MFSAYTLRKMLPKLIAAVILIQLSWYIAEFAINISNDLGRGIAEIMAAPFGGLGEINDITTQLAKVGGTGQTYAAGIFIGIVVSGLALINIGGLLMLAIPVVLAVIIGFFVLFLREILILLCVLTIPIAIALWVLPGTERYWRYWRDNFIKLLLMFPMIVALIYAGKIFATVAATGGDGFFTVVAILIGFFAPLAILPMTFRWGGSALALMANGAMNSRVNKAIGDKTRSFAGGLNERAQGKAANKYDANDKALKITKSKWGIPMFGGRAVSRIRSGNYVPLSERSRRLTIAKGDKWANDRNEEAAALARNKYNSAMANGYTDGNGKKYEPGVTAAKQALLDAALNDGTSDADNRLGKEAMKQLLDTQSWIEFQSSTASTGANKGKRIYEHKRWREMMSTNPSYYGAVIKSRPDMAADVIESAAQKDADGNLVKDARGELVIDDKLRLKTAIDRLQAESIPGIHQGFFEDIASHNDEELSKALQDRLHAIATSGSPSSANAIASLVGAEEEKVNGALGHTWTDTRPDGSVRSGPHPAFADHHMTVQDLVSATRRPAAGTTPVTPVNPTVPMTGVGGSTAAPTVDSGSAVSSTAPTGSAAEGGPHTVAPINYEHLTNTISHAVEKGMGRAMKKNAPGEVIVEHTLPTQPGETHSPGGVILTPGAQRNLEEHPPTMPRTDTSSSIITPDRPYFRPPSSDDLPK